MNTSKQTIREVREELFGWETAKSLDIMEEEKDQIGHEVNEERNKEWDDMIEHPECYEDD